MIGCCNIDTLFAILDWCGRHSALLVAIAGFISSVAIAKITSGLELKKTLCLRRFDAYEKAISHLSSKLNIYQNILAAFETLNEPNMATEVMKSKVALLLMLFVRLGEIEKEDRDLVGIAFYTKLPTHDLRPLTRETAHFWALLQDFSNRANFPNVDEQLKQFAPRFISGVKRLEPLVVDEANHLNAIYDQLSNDIKRGKVIKMLFRKV